MATQFDNDKKNPYALPTGLPNPEDDFDAGLAPVPQTGGSDQISKIRELNPDFASLAEGFMQFARERGVPDAYIKSGYRTAEQQNRLFNDPKYKARTKGNDGFERISPHQQARAIDWSTKDPGNRDKMHTLLAAYARKHNLHIPADEPWHITGAPAKGVVSSALHNLSLPDDDPLTPSSPEDDLMVGGADPTTPSALSNRQQAQRAIASASDPLARMHAKYPWTRNIDVNILDSTAKGDPSRKLEFYPADERDNPQPGKPTIEMFDRSMKESDLMGELLSHHLANTDPAVGAFRQRILTSMTPQQKRDIRGDYETERRQGLTTEPFETWLTKQGGDSFFRGYPTGQWPASEYTTEQKRIYKELQSYLNRQPAVSSNTTAPPIEHIPNLPYAAGRQRRTTDIDQGEPTAQVPNHATATFTPGTAMLMSPGETLSTPGKVVGKYGQAALPGAPVSATFTPGQQYLMRTLGGELPPGRQRSVARTVAEIAVERAQRRRAETRREKARKAIEGAQVTTADAAWHFGVTPEEAQRLPAGALQILAERVVADQKRRESGVPIPQPTPEQRNATRALAGLPPLGIGSSGIGELRRIEATENRPLGVGDLRRQEAADAQRMSSPGVGELRRIEDYDARVKQQIRAQVEREYAERESSASSGTEAQLMAQRARQHNPNIVREAVNAEVEERYAAYLRQQDPEMIASRKLLGSETAAQRVLTVPTQKFAGDVIKMAGGITGLGGLKPNDVSNYLNRRAQILTESASMAPLGPTGEAIQKSVPEKVATAVVDLGFTVFEIAALKKVTGLSFGKVMALETALKTSDVPLPRRTMQVAQSYALGRILETHLSRPVTAALFGGPAGLENYAQYKEGTTTAGDALLNTGIQAGAGFILGGKGPKEPLMKAAEIGARAEITPEWLRTRVAETGGLQHIVLREKAPLGTEGESQSLAPTEPVTTGRALSVYRDPSDPEARKVGGTEISAADAESYGKRGIQIVDVTPEQFETALKRVNSINPEVPAELQGIPPTTPQIPETASPTSRPPLPRSAEEVRAVDTARETREAQERASAAEAARTPEPVREKDAILSALDRANQAGDGSAVRALIDKARSIGADTSEIDEVLRRPSGAVPVTPPTPETPRVPEKPETIKAQVDALKRGDRKAVVLPPGTQLTAATEAEAKTYQHLRVVTVADGTRVLFDPREISPVTVKQMISEGRINELLGIPNPETQQATTIVTAQAGKETAGVPAGTELASAYVEPQNVDEAKKTFEDQFAPHQPIVEAGGSDLEARVLDTRQQESPVTSFTTSQGSTYSVSGQTTQRTKAPHVGHDPADVGLKRPSERTLYLDEDAARRVGMWNTLNAYGKRVIVKNHELWLTSINPMTGGRGRDERLSFTTEPAVGKSPLELWDRSESLTDHEAYRANHPGTPITEIQTSPVPAESVPRPKQEQLPAARTGAATTPVTDEQETSPQEAASSPDEDYGPLEPQMGKERRTARRGVPDDKRKLWAPGQVNRRAVVRPDVYEIFTPERRAEVQWMMAEAEPEDIDNMKRMLAGAMQSVSGRLTTPPQSETIPKSPAESKPVSDGITWKPFPPESSTLGIKRAAMPQIKSEHRGALANRLKARGINYTEEEVLPGTLKPSQAGYSPEKVEKARGWTGPERKLLVSADNFVLDGHHQWKQKLEDAPEHPIPIIRLSVPAQEALLELSQFPSSEVQGSHAEGAPGAEDDFTPLTEEEPAQPRRVGPEQPSPIDVPEMRKAAAEVFPEPTAAVNLKAWRHLKQPDRQAALTPEEAAERLQSWKDYATRVGQQEDHSGEVVLSLFDKTGVWSQPYRDAGYTVIQYDVTESQDDDLLEHFPVGDIDDIYKGGGKIIGVLAAPPCTSFTSSGAHSWPTQHDLPDEAMVEKKYGWWAPKHFDTPTDYAKALVYAAEAIVEMANPTEFHVLENPIGRIQRVTGLPEKATLEFDPNDFGDPYTKRTRLWGHFNPHLPTALVEPTEGTKIAMKLRGDVPEQKALRSATPEGFAYAFFVANNTSEIPFEGAQTDVHSERHESRPERGNAGEAEVEAAEKETEPEVVRPVPGEVRQQTLKGDETVAQLEQGLVKEESRKGGEQNAGPIHKDQRELHEPGQVGGRSAEPGRGDLHQERQGGKPVKPRAVAPEGPQEEKEVAGVVQPPHAVPRIISEDEASAKFANFGTRLREIVSRVSSDDIPPDKRAALQTLHDEGVRFRDSIPPDHTKLAQFDESLKALRTVLDIPESSRPPANPRKPTKATPEPVVEAVGRPTIGQMIPVKTVGDQQPYSLQVKVVDGDQVMIGHPDSEFIQKTIPLSSFQQFADDLAGVVSVPADSKYPEINSVAKGESEYLGKGDDGLAFRVGQKAVKVSTVVPFVPTNPWSRTPEEAVKMLKDQSALSEEMSTSGVPGILPVTFVEHGGKGFQIKKYVEVPEKFTADQIAAVRKTIDTMHAKGFALMDRVEAGVSNGKVYLYDTGKAIKLSDQKQERDDQIDTDNLYFTQFAQQHGESNPLPLNLYAQKRFESWRSHGEFFGDEMEFAGDKLRRALIASGEDAKTIGKQFDDALAANRQRRDALEVKLATKKAEKPSPLPTLEPEGPTAKVVVGDWDAVKDADLKLVVSHAQHHYTLWHKIAGGRWNYLQILGRDRDAAHARASEVADRVAAGDYTGIAFSGSDVLRHGAKTVGVLTEEYGPEKLLPSDLVAIGEQKVGFGKYSNVMVKDLPEHDPDYTQWLVDNGTSKRAAVIAGYLRELPEFVAAQESVRAEVGEVLTPENINKLQSFGLTATVRPDNKIVIGGSTYDWKERIKAAGARVFDRDAGGWPISPSGFKEFVGGLPDVDVGSGDSVPAYVRDPELARLRETIEQRPDRSGFSEPVEQYIGTDTRALLEQGLKVGMPQVVVDEQVEDVARINRAYQQGSPLFMLASEPGSGKTYVLGGAIREILRTGPKKIVYATLRQELITQIKQDLSEFGVDQVEFVTYPALREMEPGVADVLIFDEAHSIKNVGSDDDSARQAQQAAKWIKQARFTLLATATPGENPVQYAYLEPTGIFEEFGGFEPWAKAFGAKVLKLKDDSQIVYWKRTKYSDADQRAARDFFVREGVYTSRRIRLPEGMVDSRLVKVVADKESSDIYNALSRAAEEHEAQLVGFASMWVTNFQKRLLEATKVQRGIEEAHNARARGRFPIIFVETKAERRIDIPDLLRREHEWERAVAMAQQMKDRPPRRKEFGLPPAGIPHMLATFMDDTGIEILTIPSAEDLIRTALGEDQVAIFTGSVTPKKAQENLNAWRAGTKPILVATMAKGGTGLSLHDKVGNHPTTQININLPWTATQVIQVTQRSARYGLNSQAEMQWLFADNIPFDQMLSARVGGRMADMGALVHGERLKGSAELEDWNFDDVLFSERNAAIVPQAIPSTATLSESVDEAAKPEQTVSNEPSTARVEQPVREARGPKTETVAGKATRVKIPGSDRAYEGRYVVREADDVIPSHNPFNFQPNPDYHYTNDRRYDREPQYQKQVIDRAKATGREAFDPAYVINTSPTAENGPPVIDADGNVLGGNSRAMIVHRIYGDDDPTARDAYREALNEQASIFKIDPEQFASMQKPMLVRELDDEKLESNAALQKIITELNLTSTTPLTQDEQSAAAAQQISEEAAQFLTDMIDRAGEDATAASVMDSHGPAIINRLIEDGIFQSGDRNRLLRDGKATPEAKTRVESILVGSLYADLAQMQATPPGVRKNIERIVLPMRKIAGSEWDVADTLKGAIDATIEARATDLGQDFEKLRLQVSMVRPPFTDDEIAMAKVLVLGPVKTAKRFKNYASEFERAQSGQMDLLSGEVPNQSNSAEFNFGFRLGGRNPQALFRRQPVRPGRIASLPTKNEMVAILVAHPLIRLRDKVNRVFLVGSQTGLAPNQPHPTSDVDVLLEVPERTDMTAHELTEQYRRRLQQYFVKHKIRGQRDDLHPQWEGKRVDVYFTYDADKEDARPKVELSNARRLSADIRQRDTPEFKRWFGESKVVDDDGQPLVVYHGTKAEFDRFSKDVEPNFENPQQHVGFFFTNDKKLARRFGGRGGRTIAAYLAINNPKIEPVQKSGLSLTDAIENDWNDEEAQAYVARLKATGHDGVIFELESGFKEYVAFEPTQIKSVGNRGSFDPANANILQRRGANRAQMGFTPEGLVAEEPRTAPRFESPIVNQAPAKIQEVFGSSPSGRPLLDVIRERATPEIRGIADALSRDVYRFSPQVGHDFARALDKLATLRATNTPIEDFLNQGSLFGKELTDEQESILRGLDKDGAKLVRYFVRTGRAGYATLDVDDVAEPYVEEEPPAQGALFRRTAYHGTTHAFDRFSLANVGTGEGAQAFGWGLYFTDRREIADYYRDQLAQRFEHKKPITYNGVEYVPGTMRYNSLQHMAVHGKQSIVEQLEDNIKFNRDYAPLMANLYRGELEFIKTVDPTKLKAQMGRVYEVELAPKEDEYLLWDKPLKEQSEKVRDALHEAALAHKIDHAEQTGAQIYDATSHDLAFFGDVPANENAHQAASKYLHSLGIRGIKYLDEGSRLNGADKYEARWSADGTQVDVYLRPVLGAPVKTFDTFADADRWIDEHKPDPTYNYVIFSDDDVAIRDVLFRKRAYHGSPKRFDKFSTEFIGEGEGHQAYGWGLYFSEHPNVAEAYLKSLSSKSRAHNTFDGKRLSKDQLKTWQDGDDRVARTFANLYEVRSRPTSQKDLAPFIDKRLDDLRQQENVFAEGLERRRHPVPGTQFSWSEKDYQDRLDGTRSYIADLEAAKKRLVFTQEVRHGAKYEVDLLADDDDFLLWDKPLDQQSEKVQHVLREAAAENDIEIRPDMQGGYYYTQIGQKSIRNQFTEHPFKAATDYLLAKGVRGVKYLDQWSRPSQSGNQTYNYVVFDDSDVEIADVLQRRRDETMRDLAQPNVKTSDLLGNLAQAYRHGTLYVNPHSLELLRRAHQTIVGKATDPTDAMYLDREMVWLFLDRLRRVVNKFPDRKTETAKLIKDIARASHDSIAQGGTGGVPVVGLFPGEGALQSRAQIQHERSHAASEKAADGKPFEERVDVDTIVAHPVSAKLFKALVAQGYKDDKPLLIEEAQAWLMSRRGLDDLGLTRDEAKSWLRTFFSNVIERNGPDAVLEWQKVVPVAREVRDDVYRSAIELNRSRKGQRQKSDSAGDLAELGTGGDGPDAGPLLRRGRGDVTGTPEFKRWFRDSKVVDGEGQPLATYHGTTRDFSEFNTGASPRTDQGLFGGPFGRGFYFATDPGVAHAYATDVRGLLRGSQIMPAYLSVTNPLIIGVEEAREVLSTYRSSHTLRDFSDRLQSGGHDGIFVYLEEDAALPTEVVVFSPTQIKSATGNRGTFDPSSPNILERRRASAKDRSGFLGVVSTDLERRPPIDSQPYATLFEDEQLTPIDTKEALFLKPYDPLKHLQALAEDLQRPEGMVARKLPKTLEAAQMETGDNLFQTPVTILDGVDLAKQFIKERGVDAAMEFVRHDKGIAWAPTGYEVLAHLRAEETEKRKTDPEAADRIADKRLRFLDEFVERSTELGRAIVGIRAVEMYAPDRAAYHLNKASMRGPRRRGISKDEESNITGLAEDLERYKDRVKNLEDNIAYRIEVARSLEEDLVEAQTRVRRREKYGERGPSERKPKEYEVQLEERANTIKDSLVLKIGKFDFGNMKVSAGKFPEQEGAIGDIHALPGDAELLAEYAASQLSKVNTVAELNDHMLTTFGSELEPYLPAIRKRAYQIRKNARRAELESGSTVETRRRTILQEIQKEIAQERQAITDLEQSAVRANKEREKAEKQARQQAEQQTKEARRKLELARNKEERDEARRHLSEAKDLEREKGRSGRSPEDRRPHSERQSEIRDARQRLKNLRKEYQDASKSESAGWREQISAQREAERVNALWDTPVRRTAAAARERLAGATNLTDPQVMEDLSAVGAEKFLPDKPGGPARMKAVNPARFYVDMKEEFPTLVTPKNQGEVYRRAFQRMRDVNAVARESARQRSMSNESQRLWERLGVDTEAQALFIERKRLNREQHEIRRRMNAEFERVSQSLPKKLVFEIATLWRALQSSIDAPTGRQGWYLLATHPLETLGFALSRTPDGKTQFFRPDAPIPMTVRGYKADIARPGDIVNLMRNPVTTWRTKPWRRGEYQGMVEELQRHRLYEVAVRAGLDLPVILRDADQRLMAEEDFQSAWAAKFPHVRLSEQAFVAGMNSARLTAFERIAAMGESEGYTWDSNAEFFRQAAAFVNASTGRANMPEVIKRMSALTNILFYSTRLNASRIQLLNQLFNPFKYLPAREENKRLFGVPFFNPLDSGGGGGGRDEPPTGAPALSESGGFGARGLKTFDSYDPVMRRMMMKDLLRLAGYVFGLLLIARLLGLSIELGDLDKSDWGKLRWGKTTYDVTGGHANTIRYFLMFLRGVHEYWTTPADKLKERDEKHDPWKILATFMKYKFGPIASFFYSLTYGTDVTGQPANFRVDKGASKTLNENIPLKMIMPIIFNDITEAITQEGWFGAVKVLPAFSGVGVQTYETKPAETPTEEAMRVKLQRDTESPEERARRDLIRQFKSDRRAGKPVTDQIDQAVQEGKLRPGDRTEIARESAVGDTEEKFKNLPVVDAMDIYEKTMTDEDRAKVKDLLIRKGPSIYNLPLPEQPAAAERFQRLTGEAPPKKVRRTKTPRWFEQLRDSERGLPTGTR